MKLLISFALSSILIFSLTGCVDNAEFEELKKEQEEMRSEIAELKQNKTDVQNLIQSENASEADYTLTAGDYEISIDIAEGKYDVVCVSGNGVFNVLDSEKGYIISETMNITNEYGITERKNANLSNGQTVNITGTLTVKLIKK